MRGQVVRIRGRWNERALIDRLEGKSARSARVSFVLEPLGELLEVFLELVVLFLVILQALIVRLVSFVTILEGG